ncbi:hypothetical protein [Sunxiuqinia indica]|uniref:hypothetical protein n=1 Tax=Sunxiuqinia indica TaxID=2692584 RepID=UPI001356E973|nr:hypothetical protein [Sunxiuqinia indica]
MILKLSLRPFYFMLLMLLLGLVMNLKAQHGSDSLARLMLLNDSLQGQISRLEMVIDEGSYTRIPNEDFEEILNAKIQTSMREIANWWLFVIAALISLLGFLVNRYARSYLQTTIEGKVNQLKTENEDRIKEISNQYFSSVINSLLDFKIDTIKKNKHRVKEEEVDDLKSYLNDETVTIPEHKNVTLIDTIMRCYYYSSFPQRLEKMIGLIKEYEERYILLHTTYANSAIAFNDMYHLYGAKHYLDDAIENCDKSIKILPDYGLAFALKLELYIMGISKAFDEEERETYEKDLMKVFNDIENNKSSYLCKELIKRFEVDMKNFMRPYLEKLYAEYPNEIEKIRNRASAETPPAN